MIHNEPAEVTMNNMVENSVDLIITSPPYNLGKEYEKKQSFQLYKSWINGLIPMFHKVLSKNGSICFQIGNYIENGAVYPLDCIFFESFVKAGFIPRNRIIWHFGHGLHCKNRLSGRHETILWFTKSNDYVFNLDPIRVPSKYPNKKHYKGKNKGQKSGNPLGKNPSDVWDIPNVKHNHPEKTDHPCQFPLELSNRLIKSLTNIGDVVYDPFGGSGTVIESALINNRIGIISELDKSYCEIAENRISKYKLRQAV